MTKQYLSVRDLSERFSVSTTTIWRWARNDKFPKPIRFSGGCTRWSLEDLNSYMEEFDMR